MKLSSGSRGVERRVLRLRPAIVVASVLAAGAMPLGHGSPDPAGALGFSFTNTARQAGLDSVIVYGGATSNKYLLETTGTGVAAIDYDNDGWLDLFFVNGSTLEGFPAGRAPTNHLYRNKGDGTFEDVTVKAGLAASAGCTTTGETAPLKT